MINEKRNKGFFLLKCPESLKTKSTVESEFFGDHWKDGLLGSFGNQQFTEAFHIHIAAQHSTSHFGSSGPIVLQRVEKTEPLSALTVLVV